MSRTTGPSTTYDAKEKKTHKGVRPRRKRDMITSKAPGRTSSSKSELPLEDGLVEAVEGKRVKRTIRDSCTMTWERADQERKKREEGSSGGSFV